MIQCPICKKGKLTEVSREEYLTYTPENSGIEIVFQCSECKRTPQMNFSFDSFYDEDGVGI